MNFIEIHEGLSVNINEVEAVEAIDEFTCRVYTDSNTYTSTFPYLTLLQLIEIENKPEPLPREVSKTMNVVRNMGIFEG